MWLLVDDTSPRTHRGCDGGVPDVIPMFERAPSDGCLALCLPQKCSPLSRGGDPVRVSRGATPGDFYVAGRASRMK